VGTDDTCPQGSLSLLDRKVEVGVSLIFDRACARIETAVLPVAVAVS
jgi:hypothetical protein